jgi:hypothetical protein
MNPTTSTARRLAAIYECPDRMRSHRARADATRRAVASS